ncbi:hypothetical protein KGF57_004718 [Candida theae]|uniref:Uncharacterized protein n=1 Tax=Candida theae TaxID=1198502 RepID=A0AAD5BAP0_9ASCO|nr:uncharacterized protein KGF57_004718 [Candida theae]KAI5949508.1 hypothetical protein KGF57_004718 [Candida theae]
MPEVEVSFFNYYNQTLSLLVYKNPEAVVESVARYDSDSYPKLRSTTTKGFFDWLRRMIVYKHNNFIPDSLIRSVLIKNASFVDDEALNLGVEVVTNQPFGLVWYPIDYRYLLQLEKLDAVKNCS